MFSVKHVFLLDSLQLLPLPLVNNSTALLWIAELDSHASPLLLPVQMLLVLIVLVASNKSVLLTWMANLSLRLMVATHVLATTKVLPCAQNWPVKTMETTLATTMTLLPTRTALNCPMAPNTAPIAKPAHALVANLCA